MGILVVAGAWVKRFLIVTPTLLSPFLPISDAPENYRHYWPTLAEWAITTGTLAGALLIITLMVRYIPILPIHETLAENEIKKTATV
jgi:Ni/Fe-hydrogenase subunit HybB-like protein